MNKKILVLFLTLIILKIILSLFIQFPLAYSDSLTYQESAKTFFDTLSITNLAESKYPLLYPLLISPAFFFNDMNIVMLAIRIINSILSSLIIFPMYYLAKEFFDKKKSFMIATITSFIPPFFLFTFTSMSENIFYPLFIFSILAIYKAFKNNSLKWNLLAGASIGICLLTKIISIILIPVILLLILLNLKQIKGELILLSTTAIFFLGWLIPRIFNYGFNIYQILGYQSSLEKASSSLNLSTKFIWFFLYIDYIILALGIIFFFLAILLIIKYKKLNSNQKLLIQITLFSTFFLLIISANHSGGFDKYTDYRVIGRYIECLIPLFLILSFIELENLKLKKPIIIILSLFTIISSYFILFDKFFPLNNTSLIHIGIFKYFLEYFSLNSTLIITILITIITISLVYIIPKIKVNKVHLFVLIYFILLTTANISIIFYDTQERWLTSEGAELGEWINKNLDKKSTYIFDIKDQKTGPLHNLEIETQERPTQIAAYWIRGDWVIDEINENYDYIITSKELKKELVYIGSSGTKIYRT